MLGGGGRGADLSHAELSDLGGRHELEGRLEHETHRDVSYLVFQEPHLLIKEPEGNHDSRL